ncbi:MULTISPECIES: anthranilate phosphoribosyltransferase [unclassified Sulfurospirillum]|jgi:anthranilate phosphoribosyltransferase|uniref:anthranilate phosphoribosyltransferase n=1 Tax=unclassified Sulfurospirillum TaxID=2618290 RepID=UPI000542D455|nr:MULTISPECIES: anthranilate phosphoribosyltransferase [unclassified Sulfurospirillum]KHG33656.1 MAG: anthranilate phosphoribosyltransferase [Sulfurospirillum sp. MES]MCP3651250.1 anthranilate phosphoribosyltransferase [Sulfurospirillum sp. DNRA8]MCR1810096.1 anthranilate phosphoribosyltransferase [Sulfurospirillum sp. DNRA8]
MNYQEAYEAFNALFENQLSSEEAARFLVELYHRGESFEEIAAAAKVMREHSVKLDIPHDLKTEIIDIVGTGGDKSGTFNISTTTSIVLSALGCKVAKHGSGSATSLSGSADVLRSLGLNLNLTPEKQVKMLQECGFVFMFAMNHHPCMKHIMPIRRSLPHRTIFNMLGPLANPANAQKQVVGVFHVDYVERFSKALQALGTQKSMVLSSHDGLDEVGMSAPTFYMMIENTQISQGEIDPQAYGFKSASLESIQGGDSDHNADITRAILKNEEKGPKRDVVLLNGACALVVDSKARDIQEGIEMMDAALTSKQAWDKLGEIIKLSYLV